MPSRLPSIDATAAIVRAPGTPNGVETACLATDAEQAKQP